MSFESRLSIGPFTAAASYGRQGLSLRLWKFGIPGSLDFGFLGVPRFGRFKVWEILVF